MRPGPEAPGQSALLFIVVVAAGLLAEHAALALDPAKRLIEYHHRFWGTAHGLPHATVRDIEQTPDGYLWAATEYGLARFNGERFTAWHPRNTAAFSRPFLNDLALDAADALWIGSEGGGLITLENGQFNVRSTNAELAGTAVNHFHKGNQGRLWVATSGGINCVQTGRWQKVASLGWPENTDFTAVVEDEQSRLWVGSDRGLYGPLDWQQPSPRPLKIAVPGKINALCPDGRGGMWAGTDNGLKWVAADGQLVTADWGELRDPRVLALHRDQNDLLWIGTGLGINRLTHKQLVREPPIPWLDFVAIHRFFEDREGNFWVGAANGLHCLNDLAFTTISARNGLAAEEVINLIETGTNQFLAGTSRGTLYKITGREAFPSAIKAGVSRISSLLQDRQKRLWIGSPRQGLDCVAGGRLRNFQPKDGLCDSNIFCLAENQAGELLVGTGGGLNVWRQERFETIELPVKNGFFRSAVRCLLPDRQGDLWVGTQEGVFYLGRTRTNHYHEADGLPSPLVYCLQEDAVGRIWAGTANGLACHLNQQWRSFAPKSTTGRHHVYWLAHDERGFTWYSTPWTIFRVDTAALMEHWQTQAAPPEPILATQADGLLATECLGGRQPAGCRSRDGRLWFLTRRGLAVVNPAFLPLNALPPRMQLEEMLVNGQSVDLARPVRLPPNPNVVAFHYAGLSYDQPDRVQYKYRLDGADEEWVVAGNRRQAVYAHLRPGRYHFRVVACNKDGVWSAAGASCYFSIAPWFYQTWWFYALASGGAVALGAGIHLARTRLLRRQKAHLEQVVAERDRQLQAEMAQRLRLQQQLLQHKQEETIGQLAAGIAHHFNNQLQTIQGNINLLQDTPLSPAEVSSSLKNMERAVGKTAGIIQQLMIYGRRNWMRPELTNVNELVSDGIMPPAGIKLTLELADNLPPIMADDTLLARALDALLQNAREAMGGGEITLRTREVVFAAEAAAAHAERRAGKFIEIMVADQGPGFSPEALARLFEPFFTTKQTGRGIGLSLAVVLGIIKQHEGWIEVNTLPGRGCAVCCYLPVLRDAPGKDGVT